jgi:hypothetical protein
MYINKQEKKNCHRHTHNIHNDTLHLVCDEGVVEYIGYVVSYSFLLFEWKYFIFDCVSTQAPRYRFCILSIAHDIVDSALYLTN